MTTQDMDTGELVSALVDGQLRGAAFAQALALTERSAEARAQWHAYHLVGDVLRAPDLGTEGHRDAAFVARLRQRLQQEALPLHLPAAVELTPVGSEGASAPGMNAAEHGSANDALVHWKLVAGFASLAAVVMVGWQLATSYGTPTAAPQLAQAGAPAAQTSSESPMVMLRDPRLDQLLAAHQQFGGTSALQMPAGFLRNATFERPAR